MNLRKNLAGLLVSGALIAGCAPKNVQHRRNDQNLVQETYIFDYDEVPSSLSSSLYNFEHGTSAVNPTDDQLNQYRYVKRGANENNVLDYRREVTFFFYNYDVVSLCQKITLRGEASPSRHDEISEVCVRKRKDGTYHVRSTNFDGSVQTNDISELEAQQMFQEYLYNYRNGVFNNNLEHASWIYDRYLVSGR